MKQETEYADYSDFDLDGPAHRQADERFKDALADGLLKAMGLPGLACSQYEQSPKMPHERNTLRENKEQ